MIETDSQELVPLPGATPRKNAGRPPGYPKTGGRVKGTPSKTPLLAQAIANRHSPDAVNYLVGVMQGKRIARNGTWVYPSVYTRVQAAMKLLDVAEMPVKRSLLAGTPVMINISLGGQVTPVAVAPVPIESA